MGAVTTFDPHPYQLRALGFLLDEEHPSRGLWLDMGLGKTVVTLSALDYLFDHLEARKALVVGPVRVVNQGWPAEIEKWRHTRWLKFSRVLGARRDRERAARSRAPIHLTNYENLRWLIRFWADNGGWPYDTVIFDEVSKMKSPGAQRFRAFRALMQTGAVKRVISLTGTPADNSLLDLWAPTFLLDHGAALGRTAEAFKNRWFTPHPAGYGWAPRPGAREEIGERVRDLYLTMRSRDYLTLPDRIDNPVLIDLPPKARAIYDRLERDLFAVLDSGERLEMANAAVARQKARQAANGALYLQDSKRWEELHTVKLDALEEIVEEAQGAPILVGVAFHSDYDRIMARFPQARRLDKSPKTIDQWNANEIPMLLAHPGSAGYGLNLQLGGAHILVQFALPWSLGQYLQFIARLHRQGQGKPVFNHLILARDTVDELVLSALKDKQETQDGVLDAADRGRIRGEDDDIDPGVNRRVLEALRLRYGKKERKAA